MLRGGVQQIPVSATDAYFSKKRIVNDLAVNSVWNFIHSSYIYFKADLSVFYQNVAVAEANQRVAELYDAKDVAPLQIISSKKPNVILVTLEGWSAQMIEALGGEPGITPRFNDLCNEGVLFTEIYATGGTSETGHSSIISGYPTIAGISISTESAKCRNLPSLAKSFKEKGYETFYTFGGSLSYGNIGAYLTEVGFDRLIDENDLDLKPTGKLGIHDEAMFPYFLSEIKQAKRPYFYGLFTQSTHAPYDMPGEEVPGYNNDGYVNSMRYADEHLGKFVAQVRKLPDFENTLVIFIADHGRANVFNQNTYDEDYFHIPMLFWGGAVEDAMHGLKINGVGSQADLAKTLLNQLKINSAAFHWSKDLLNPSVKNWAICTSTLSYGWKDSLGYTCYQMIEGVLVDSPHKDQIKIDEALKNCRSVLESMYREYENY
jgi:phosphoglycerol transferase MdoB-like AlkP superfamily enzyme